jgi:hypothetical protein
MFDPGEATTGGKERINMKRLFVFAALLVCPALMMAQNTHFRFATEGAFANVAAGTGGTVLSLQVSRGPTGTSLQFSEVIEPADFSSITIVNEFGPIPDSAFTGQNTQNLALNIDTTTLDPSTFFSESCTISFVDFTVDCSTPPPSGLIQLNWKENDFQTLQVNDHHVQTSGPVTTRTYQRADTSTADVQGTIFGTDVSGSTANVGVNHNSTIEVIRN